MFMKTREERASPNISFPHSPDGYEARLATFQRRRLFLPSVDVLQQSGLHSWRLFAAVEGVWSIRSSSISNSWSCSDTQTVHIEIVPILKWYQIILLKIKNSDDSKWHFEHSLDVEGYHKTVNIATFSHINKKTQYERPTTVTVRTQSGQWDAPTVSNRTSLYDYSNRYSNIGNGVRFFLGTIEKKNPS